MHHSVRSTRVVVLTETSDLQCKAVACAEVHGSLAAMLPRGAALVTQRKGNDLGGGSILTLQL